METPSPSSLFVKAKNNNRRGVSPVIATTIILAITIALGLALWGFAYSGVGTATTQYSQTVDRYGEFVGDKFVIASVDFDNPTPGEVAFWIYNSGNLPTTINNIVLTCRESTCGDVSSVALSGPVVIPSKQLSKITFELTASGAIAGSPDFGNKTYELTVLSETGAKQHVIVKSD